MRTTEWILALALLVSGTVAAQEAAAVFPIRLHDGQALGKATTVKVRLGERVVLRWESDRDVALHLHGYDIEQHVPASQAADMSFKATIAGRFPITVHAQGKAHHHRAVAYLEVHP